MSNPLYGFQLYESPTNPVNENYPIIGANSVAFSTGDPVALNSTTGYLTTYSVAANNTMPVLGISAKTQTLTSSNQTVALVKPAIVPIDQDYTFLAGTNADLAATSPGYLFKITDGPTGQYLVDINSGAVTGRTAIVVCLAKDPQAKGGTGLGSGAREGLFKFVNPVNRNIAP